jgi:hypothetical protein
MGPLQETLGKDGDIGSGCLVINHSKKRPSRVRIEANSLPSAPIWANQSTNNKHASPLCPPITSKTSSVVSEGGKKTTMKQKLTPKPTLSGRVGGYKTALWRFACVYLMGRRSVREELCRGVARWALRLHRGLCAGNWLNSLTLYGAQGKAARPKGRQAQKFQSMTILQEFGLPTFETSIPSFTKFSKL